LQDGWRIRKTIARDSSLRFALPRNGVVRKENTIAGNRSVSSSISNTIRIIIGCKMGGGFGRQ